MSSQSAFIVPRVSARPSWGDSSWRVIPVRRTRSPFSQSPRSRISTVRMPKASDRSSRTVSPSRSVSSIV